MFMKKDTQIPALHAYRSTNLMTVGERVCWRGSGENRRRRLVSNPNGWVVRALGATRTQIRASSRSPRP